MTPKCAVCKKRYITFDGKTCGSRACRDAFESMQPEAAVTIEVKQSEFHWPYVREGEGKFTYECMGCGKTSSYSSPRDGRLCSTRDDGQHGTYSVRMRLQSVNGVHIRCRCCGGLFSEGEATYSSGVGSPVCDKCQFEGRGA